MKTGMKVYKIDGPEAYLIYILSTGQISLAITCYFLMENNHLGFDKKIYFRFCFSSIKAPRFIPDHAMCDLQSAE